MSRALILIDIQNDYFPKEKMELVSPLTAAENAHTILQHFRKENLEIFHIQHVSKDPNAGFFLPETNGVIFHKSVTPLETENIIIKHTPNSFFGTDLFSRLSDKKIRTLVICGMMTHMCIDSTVRAGKEHGFEIILIEDACTTKDLEYNNEVIPAKQVHRSFISALNGKFANICTANEYLENLANCDSSK